MGGSHESGLSPRPLLLSDLFTHKLSPPKIKWGLWEREGEPRGRMRGLCTWARLSKKFCRLGNRKPPRAGVGGHGGACALTPPAHSRFLPRAAEGFTREKEYGGRDSVMKGGDLHQWKDEPLQG